VPFKPFTDSRICFLQMKKLPPKPPPINGERKYSPVPLNNDRSVISAFSLIWRVLSGRRYAVQDAEIPDIAQEAAFRLWKWKEKYKEKANEMTDREWDSFIAKTTHNELNRRLSSQPRIREIPLDETGPLQVTTPEGHADSEMYSLIRNVWQEICRLTLYQRRALLLGSPELIIYLAQFGIAETKIVASIEIRKEDWAGISARLPLSDKEIAAIARCSKTGDDSKSATRAIGKARYDARRRLERLRK